MEDIKNKLFTPEEYKQLTEYLMKNAGGYAGGPAEDSAAPTYLPAGGMYQLDPVNMPFGAIEKARDFLSNKEATGDVLGQARQLAGFDPIEMQQSEALSQLQKAPGEVKNNLIANGVINKFQKPQEKVTKKEDKKVGRELAEEVAPTLLNQIEQKPEYDSRPELLDALKRVNENKLGANLFDASNTLVKGLNPLADHSSSEAFSKNLHAGADVPLQTYQQLQKQLNGDMSFNKGRLELDNEKSLNDPNSEVSSLARDTMNNLGFKVPSGISAGALKSAGINLGTLLNIKEATDAKKEVASMYNKEKQDRKEIAQEERNIKHVGELQTSFNKDKSTIKAQQGLESAEDAQALLNTDNPITSEAVKTSLARLSGEVGVLTDRDVARFGGSKAIRDQLSQSIEQMKSGKLTPQNREFMQQILTTFKTKREHQLKERALHYAKQGAAKLGVNEKDIYEKILPGEGLPEVVKREPQSEKVKVRNPQGQLGEIPATQLEQALAQGYTKV